MRCSECGGEMVFQHGTIEMASLCLGSFRLSDVDFWVCLECHERILPADTWAAADLEEERLIGERVAALPVGEFLSAAEAASLLGMSRQALHKHRRISRGFVYAIVIDKKRLYHRGSLDRFMRTGDGRFLLGSRQASSAEIHHAVRVVSTPMTAPPTWHQAPTTGEPHAKRAATAC